MNEDKVAREWGCGAAFIGVLAMILVFLLTIWITNLARTLGYEVDGFCGWKKIEAEAK